MHYTPIDIRKHTFKNKLIGGYNPSEVDRVLVQVADDFEELLRKNNEYAAQIRILQHKLELFTQPSVSLN
jgi:DivIVA domain-containing protein